ncbi:MAG: ABC transporter substrate-binding protein [Bacillota bacterium]|nr:ABC transporter substrate-binding protein [Bacillota bacterium]
MKRDEKSFKRISKFAVVILMIFLTLLSGCNSPSPNSTIKPSNTSKNPKTPITSDKCGTAVPATNDINPKQKKKLVFWSYNRDEYSFLTKMIESKFKDVELVTLHPPDSKDIVEAEFLKRILREGGQPGCAYPAIDIFSVESSLVKSFIDVNGYTSDLTDKATELIGNMYKYTVDAGTDKIGKIKALSPEICPGGIAYKKQVAKKYLGTDDPDRICEMLSTPDKMLQTAGKLKVSSNGKVTLFPDWRELLPFYKANRNYGWIIDNKLNIDTQMLDLFDYAKKLKENKYINNFTQWSQEWSTAIGADEKSLCWPVPTWGIPWIIGANDKKAADGGKWGFTTGPGYYYWGGTWYCISPNSQNQDLAWEVIKYITSDKEFLKEYIKTSYCQGSPNNIDLMKELISTGETDKTTGQNLNEYYSSIAKKCNGTLSTPYDDFIEKEYGNVMDSYLTGAIKTKNEAINKFTNKVSGKNSPEDLELTINSVVIENGSCFELDGKKGEFIINIRNDSYDYGTFYLDTYYLSDLVSIASDSDWKISMVPKLHKIEIHINASKSDKDSASFVASRLLNKFGVNVLKEPLKFEVKFK